MSQLPSAFPMPESLPESGPEAEETGPSSGALDPSPGLKSTPSKGRYLIKTFGCQMNVADTERMAALLQEKGMTEAQSPAEASVILINGCSVRDKAVHKAVSTLGRFQSLKGDRHGVPEPGAPLIGLGGCVGQLDQGKIFKNAPYLDFVFGPDTIDELPEILHRVESGERHVVYADFDSSSRYSTETKVSTQKAQAFVNIMKGCDKFCTYCIVPFTRGREKSRTIDEVLNDLARMVAAGVREVTLLGQNVNSFGKGNPNSAQREPQALHNPIGKVGPRQGEENFPQLLRAIDSDPRLASLRWIRFTSSHPLDFSDELIDCYRPVSQGGVARLAPHLHLPVQSGSNRVLQKMGRHHQIENYLAQMDRLKAINPEIGLTTDIIVGFPTETEEEFEETLTLLDRVGYDGIYAFAYSSRPGTRASKLEDDVPSEVKNARLNRILEHQAKIAERRHAARVGREFEVLVESESKHHRMSESSRDHHAHSEGTQVPTASRVPTSSRVWMGHTPCNRVVNFVAHTPRSLLGQFVRVRVVGSTALALQAEWLPKVEEAQGQRERQLGAQ